MKLEEVRSIARSHSIKLNNLPKTALIKKIQSAEGNFDCFSTAYGGACYQVNCLWRGDCFLAAVQGA